MRIFITFYLIFFTILFCNCQTLEKDMVALVKQGQFHNVNSKIDSLIKAGNYLYRDLFSNYDLFDTLIFSNKLECFSERLDSLEFLAQGFNHYPYYMALRKAQRLDQKVRFQWTFNMAKVNAETYRQKAMLADSVNIAIIESYINTVGLPEKKLFGQSWMDADIFCLLLHHNDMKYKIKYNDFLKGQVDAGYLDSGLYNIFYARMTNNLNLPFK